MSLKKIIDFYYDRNLLHCGSIIGFVFVFSVGLFLMTACQPPTKPLVDDEKQFMIGGALPQNQAKEIASKYVSRAWVEKPYLMCQVNHLDQFYNTNRIEYNVKKYISFMDMELYPIIGRDECLNVLVSQMDVFDADNHKRTYYMPKSICCNIKSERDELVQALISLGVRVGRDMSMKNLYHY